MATQAVWAPPLTFRSYGDDGMVAGGRLRGQRRHCVTGVPVPFWSLEQECSAAGMGQGQSPEHSSTAHPGVPQGATIVAAGDSKMTLSPLPDGKEQTLSWLVPHHPLGKHRSRGMLVGAAPQCLPPHPRSTHFPICH